jgi:hypothetical protein
MLNSEWRAANADASQKEHSMLTFFTKPLLSQ